MTPHKTFALEAYYWATAPFRSLFKSRIRAKRQMPLCVPFYHRIADTHPNDWTMSKLDFANQLNWMERNVELISLEETQQRMRSGTNDRVSASITFDDGYAENCEFAIPELVRRDIPCTYFVSLDFILTQRPFPHDEQAGCPLPPNTIDQIRAMANDGVEIGAHTRNHPNVGSIRDAETLYDEIVVATQELADLIDRPVRYFAFPFGKPDDLSQQAADLARENGLLGVCSAYGAYNLPGDDPFHIQRIHGDPEFIRLKNWLTIDPRKLSIGRDFQMQSVPLDEPSCWAGTTS